MAFKYGRYGRRSYLSFHTFTMFVARKLIENNSGQYLFISFTA